MLKKPNIDHIALIFFVIVFMFVVWPTPHKEYFVVQNGQLMHIRVNRFTGDVQILTATRGWVEARAQYAD